MENLFFELIQVSVGRTDCLSNGPSAEEWEGIRRMACRHRIGALCYHGVERLFEYGLRAPQDMAIDWMSEAEEMRENALRDQKRCLLVQKRLSEKNIRSAVITGPAVASYYRGQLEGLRQPDTTDILVECEQKRIVRFVELTGQEQVRQLPGAVWLDRWSETPMRLIYQLWADANPLEREKRRRWADAHRDAAPGNRNGLLTVPLRLAVVSQLTDLYDKFYTEGADMGLLADLYFLLEAAADGQGELAGLDADMKALGLLKFAEGTMWMLHRVFAMDADRMPCKMNEHEGHFLLEQIMRDHPSRLQQLLKHPMQTLRHSF